jgi:hypothetical protein
MFTMLNILRRFLCKLKCKLENKVKENRVSFRGNKGGSIV